MKKTFQKLGKFYLVTGGLAIMALHLISFPGAIATEHQKQAISKSPQSSYDITKEKVVYMIGYAHLDTQWRWHYRDTIEKHIPSTMHKNFELFEKYPNYVFNFTGSRRYQMMKEYYPEDYEKVKQYIAEGRWHVCGSSVDECDVNIPSSESIIRHVLYGNDFFRKEFGKESLDFILPDCFGFPSALPSILAYCGIKGFSTQKLTWGSAVGIPFPVGVWEGPDGNWVVAALNPGSYVSKIGHDLSHDTMLLDRISATGEKCGAYVDYRYYGTGDIGGSPTEESVQWIEKSIKSDGKVKVISSPGDRMFRDLEPSQTGKMPRYKGDLLLTEHSAGCITSQCYMKRWNRKNELLADAAERAAVVAQWLGSATYPREKLKNAWCLVLGSQMHDIMPGTSIPKAYEYSWNDEVIAMNQFADVLENSVGAIAQELDTTGEGIPLVVYNPLSIEREDIVEATIAFDGNVPRWIRVFGPQGNEVPSQTIPKWEILSSVLFLARVPPVSFSVFHIRSSEEPCKIETGLKITEHSIENDRYIVTLNKNGDVSSIRDKQENRELLSAPVRLGFFEDSPKEWPAWNMDWEDKQKPVKCYVTDECPWITIRETGPVRGALQVVRKCEGSEFTQIIRLGAGGAGDRVEFDTKIDWRTREACLKACFPLSVSNPKATYSQDLGTIQRGNNDPKKYEVPSHKWIDLTDKSGKYGVAVLEDCKYGSDKPDDNTIRLTLIRTPGANSYQDQATQDLGMHQALFALSGHKGDWRTGDVQWKAERLNQSLIPFQAKPHPGKLGKSFSLLELNSKHLKVQAIKKAENSDDIIIRFQELLGQPCKGIEVSLGSGIASASEVNGQEFPLRKAEIEKGKLKFDMGSYSPKSFAIKFKTPEVNIAKPESRIVKIPYEMNPASFDKSKGEGDFDGEGRTYPAELFPSHLVCGDIEYSLVCDGKKGPNCLSCRGQKIPLPKGNYNRLYILASAVGGDVIAKFQIDNRTLDLRIQEWKGKIGQWNNRIWKSGKRDILGLEPYFIKRDPVAWFASHIHSNGENEPYTYCYLFRYELEISPGAKTLILPKNKNVRIFAITVAENKNEGVIPAAPLYDELSQKDSEPRIEPVNYNPEDAMEIRILPGWFSRNWEIYYNTTGHPLLFKKLYRRPFYIYKDTMVHAWTKEENGRPGLPVAMQFSVNDITAPSIVRVSASCLTADLYMEFSEPLDRTSAETTDHYEIKPECKIISAKLSQDERTVILTLSKKPEEGKEYIVSVQGIRDRSPKANTLKQGTSIAFAPKKHILRLGFDDKGAIGEAMVRGKKISAEIKGKPTWAEGKISKGALRFNGNTECLIFPDCPELNPTTGITLAAWFNAKDWNGNRRILQKGNKDNQYRLLKEGDHFKFSLRGVGEITGKAPSVGKWHHAAGSWNGKAMRLFIDGKLVAEEEATGKIAKTSDPLYIGTKTWGTVSGDFFKGMLDEVTIWDYGLTTEEIKVLFSGK